MASYTPARHTKGEPGGVNGRCEWLEHSFRVCFTLHIGTRLIYLRDTGVNGRCEWLEHSLGVGFTLHIGTRLIYLQDIQRGV